MGRSFVIAALLLAGPSRAIAEPIDVVPDGASPCARPADAASVSLPGSGLVIALPRDNCAETPQPPARPRGPDIFGSVALAISSTPLDKRWQAARGEQLLAEGPWATMLQSAAGRDRSAQIRLVNGWVNSHLGFADDVDRDEWASATRAFARGRGDCEDFAIAKLQLLESLGVAGDDLYLVIVRDEPRGADHAVLAVRDGASLAVLDSRSDRILGSDEDAGYRPILSYSTSFAWTHGYASGAAGGGSRRDNRVATPH
ncbi:transglutaminase-like cysteine peptidase [Sphingomonas cavernae]|uniref:transglutaminase-like cysteine peptidase n=1 Tax=Sphingomonas cavernae TaxID=2320861 RepID=UPI0016007379|nr:transglutaminase-like cysteine peptidase [Sphingomonas cavernae]